MTRRLPPALPILAAALGVAVLSTPGLAAPDAPKPKAAPGAPSAGTQAKGTKAKAEASPADVVIVEGKGVRVTAADVKAELRHQPGRARLVERNPEALRELVTQMVRMELMAQEAKRLGYDKHPAVVQAAKEEAVQELHRTLVDVEITPASIPLDQIAAFYKENETQFKRPAMRRARHILLEDEDAAKALLTQAREASDREFQALAREHSIDTETKQRGGDLRFFALDGDPQRREAPVHPALRKAAFALEEVGQTVSQPVKVDGRYSILRLTGIREARETTLAKAEPSIRTRLWRQKRKEAVTNLMQRLEKELKPQVFAERVEAIDLRDATQRPVGFAPDPGRRRREAKQETRAEQPPEQP